MASFGGERRLEARRASLSRARRFEPPQALFDGSPGGRELHPPAIQALHLRQDEIRLRLVQFADEQRNHLAAAIREYGERKYRRFDAERGSRIEGVLLADEQWI